MQKGRNKKLRVICSVAFILLAAWVATPKVYIHALLQHNHSLHAPGGETSVQSHAADDCEFEKYNKPAYFSIFKFISSFLPLKERNADRVGEALLSITGIATGVPLLRAPPVH